MSKKIGDSVSGKVEDNIGGYWQLVFKESKDLSWLFLEQCTIYHNVPFFISKYIKKKVQQIVLEQSLLSQTVLIQLKTVDKEIIIIKPDQSIWSKEDLKSFNFFS